ncbi:hypothetical protein AcW1_003149 [Taiwanofungus camphoratus]|nr:hypothetical protein AcW1_003149 [Antrodia cinnamomea]
MNNGDAGGLFRGAVMESGSMYALRNMSAGQPYYDQLVEYTKCSGQADTLDCLRRAPYEQLIAAVNLTPTTYNYTTHNLAWQPRLDGEVFARNPQRSVEMGLYAKVPIISGDCDDEGTLFSIGNLNITTDEEFLSYVHSNYIPDASTSSIVAIGEAYSEDPSLGSPFGTGNAYNLTPQYKRLAAFQGDFVFQAPRRFYLGTLSRSQDAWAYLWKRNKSTPYLGSYHSSDLSEFFDGEDAIGTDASINFATNLNPNAPPGLAPNVSILSNINWEQWASAPTAPPLLTFLDPAPSIGFTSDIYRFAAMNLLASLTLQMP